MYMYLSNPKRYYDSNDRTINLLMKGDVDMSATTYEEDGGPDHSKDGFSDSGVREIAKTETEVELFIVDTNKTGRWIILAIP